MKKLKYVCLFIIGLYEWTDLFCWMIGWAVINLLKGNFEGFIEMTYWIKIHLTHSGCTGEKRKLPFKEILIGKLTALFGFILISLFLFLLFKITKQFIKN